MKLIFVLGITRLSQVDLEEAGSWVDVIICDALGEEADGEAVRFEVVVNRRLRCVKVDREESEGD